MQSITLTLTPVAQAGFETQEPESLIELAACTALKGDKGDKGDKGEQGDVGDVNPEMHTILAATVAARDESVSQATAAAASASSATTKSSEAASSAGTAAAQADIATAQAGIATTKAGEAAADAQATAADRAQTGLDAAATAADRVQTGADRSSATTSAAEADASAFNAANSATASANSASLATDIKGQTEYIRDQALAGLGAADNSQALSELLGAVAYATDMALKGIDGIVENRGTVGSTDRAELYALIFGELLDKIGVIGRAISGGTISLQAGTAAIPSMTSASDVATGVFFPAAGAVALATAALERLRVTADGRLGIGTTTPTGLLDVADNKLRVRTAQTPASATAAGNQGEIAWDANYIYACIATNTWRRAALSTW